MPEKNPKLRLSRLRDIGWKYWDPIGLLDEGDSWEGKPFADEYDTYLRIAAGMVRREVPDDEVAAYLVKIESEHMGLGPATRTSAFRVIDVIKADPHLWAREPDAKSR